MNDLIIDNMTNIDPKVGDIWKHKDGEDYEVLSYVSVPILSDRIYDQHMCIWYCKSPYLDSSEIFIRTKEHFLNSFIKA